MTVEKIQFFNKTVELVFDGSLESISNWGDISKMIVITDENVFEAHQQIFQSFKTILVPSGEIHKQQSTVDKIIDDLLQLEADKQSIIVGVGGGVVTDMAGYAASIYKRGIRLMQVPTSLLGMVDAAVGGKNGVDVGPCKNMVGTIYQPDVLLYDYSFLKTLPEIEWVNGFAEIIKHACIKDANMFTFLQGKVLADFIKDPSLIATLVEQNVKIKLSVVLNDEFETGDRKLLNFGHTIGHAIENRYDLSHGFAISIGMAVACNISEEINQFQSSNKLSVLQLLQQYGLPVQFDFDPEKIWEILILDKKRNNEEMGFILLDAIGKGKVSSIPLQQLKDLLNH
ncbi:MAG: 3-dehydroquinate synthase [Ferruginibacter sp.]